MVNKRGLSPTEWETLDPDILEALMVYDTYIDPSGTKIDMLFHANSLYTQAILSPNMSDSSRKQLKVQDFDFLGVLDNLTQKEREEKKEKDKANKQKDSIKSIGDAIKKSVLGKEYGKE